MGQVKKLGYMNEWEALAEVKFRFGSHPGHHVSCWGGDGGMKYSVGIDQDITAPKNMTIISCTGKSWEDAIEKVQQEWDQRFGKPVVLEPYNIRFPDEWEPNDYY